MFAGAQAQKEHHWDPAPLGAFPSPPVSQAAGSSTDITLVPHPGLALDAVESVESRIPALLQSEEDKLYR